MLPVLLAAGLAVSFAFQPAPGVTQAQCTTPTTDGQVIMVRVGTNYAVAFESNAGTGYSWALRDAPDASVSNMLDLQMVPPPRALPGAAEFTCFIFEANGVGTTGMTFVYVRPFEPDVEPAQTVAVRVVVGRGGVAPVQVPGGI
jgi:predicted secreted protein